MNIFILSEQTNPVAHYNQNAEFHCDKHVVKMIAESTQLIVTALCQTSYAELGIYMPDSIVGMMPCKPLGAAHAKHPCAIWTKQSIANLNYVACLALQLCNEHQCRYPLSATHAYMPWLSELVSYLSVKGFGYNAPLPTCFAIAIKSAAKQSVNSNLSDAVAAYRAYYFSDKRGFATWRKRMKPVWWLLLEESL